VNRELKKEEEGRGRRGAGRQVGTSNGGKEGMTTLEAEGFRGIM